MGAKFHHLPTWGPSDRRLSKEALVLQSYLGRCPTRTSEGLFSLALGYVAVDTPLTEAEALTAFQELSKAGIYDYDAANEVVLDRTALKTNPLRNPRDKQTDQPVVDERTGDVKVDKRIPNATRLFAQVPDSALKIAFVALADLYSPDLADAIRADSTYAYPSPLEGPSEDHASTIEGASREEQSRDEDEPTREEWSSQLDPSTRASEEEKPRRIGNGEWSYGNGIELCVVCGDKCHVRDPDGRPRHHSCELTPDLQVVAEAGF